MAERFTDAQWTKIINQLERDPAGFGMPEGGREKSLVFGSFNIRKLSSRRRRKQELDSLARFCACCDLVSIQEVQDNLDGLRYLQQRTEIHIAGDGEYALAVSDITGEVPGERGMTERLAFLYRHRRVRRLDMASDLTYDRTAVLRRFFDNETVLIESRRAYEAQVRRFEIGELSRRPTYHTPTFVTFVRTPYVVAFEAPAANDAPPLRFTAVNAHLVYGSVAERTQEFQALLDWIVPRLKAQKRLVAPNFVLLGDLNLNFDNPDRDRPKFEDQIRRSNIRAFGDPDIRRVYFPFIDRHPVSGDVFRTNARVTETFDQIGFFRAADETRLPNDKWRAEIASRQPDGFDYGVFNFADLFAQALHGQLYKDLGKAKRVALTKKFEHSVSDHLPIWVRIPRPGFAPPPAV